MHDTEVYHYMFYTVQALVGLAFLHLSSTDYLRICYPRFPLVLPRDGRISQHSTELQPHSGHRLRICTEHPFVSPSPFRGVAGIIRPILTDPPYIFGLKSRARFDPIAPHRTVLFSFGAPVAVAPTGKSCYLSLLTHPTGQFFPLPGVVPRGGFSPFPCTLQCIHPVLFIPIVGAQLIKKGLGLCG